MKKVLLILVFALFGLSTFGQVNFSDKALLAHPGDEIIVFDGNISSLDAILLKDGVLPFISSVNMDELVSTFYLKIGNSISSYIPTATTDGSLFFEGSYLVEGNNQQAQVSSG
jgi:hypothetical protein